jgi:hypothetical protein
MERTVRPDNGRSSHCDTGPLSTWAGTPGFQAEGMGFISYEDGTEENETQ